MTSTWFDFCERVPGPAWKVGYGSLKAVSLGEIEGTVDHSAEGTMAGLLSVLNGPRYASWTFSIPKVGRPKQHYSVEDITWQAGLPGDRRIDTSLIGNLVLRGKEFVGKAGELWTDNQVYWSARIDVEMRKVAPQFAANPPTLRLNQWEHNWLSDTSCPSGRNLWGQKFALINEWEDDMVTPEEMQAACEAALDAKASELRKWAKRGGWDAIDDKLPVIVAAIVKAMPSGGTWTEAQLVTVMKGVLKRQKLVVD